MTTLRQATPDDVQDIAAVIKDVFGETIDQARCRDLLAGGEYIVRVAAAGEDVYGFAAGFLTSPGGMVRRWEVELLGVHSDHQGQGLGTQLVEAAWTIAEANQVKFARGLVRADNEGAQKCFERVGFASSGEVFDLIQWGPVASDASASSHGMMSLLPVETLTYRGVWIEGLDVPLGNDADRAATVKAARAVAFRENRDFASAVVPSEKPLSAEVMGNGVIVGQYQWWRKP